MVAPQPVDFDQLIFDASLAMVGVVVAWVLCYFLFRKMPIYDQKKGALAENPGIELVMDAVDGIYCTPYFMILAGFALHATWQLGVVDGTLGGRWYAQTWTSYWFQIMYVVRMIKHTPIQWITLRNNPTLRLQMTAHHILSALCFCSGLFTGRMHFFAAFDGCCEVTTVFLNALFCFRTFAPSDACSAGKAVSGLGLWLGFLVFRLLLFPIWLYTFVTDVRAAPAATWALLNPFEKYGYFATTLVLLGLSAAWFVPITKGLLKALGLTKPKKAKGQ